MIRLAVSNFPVNTNVPASRPTLPIINSTAPEKVTEVLSPRLHFASEGVADPQTFERGSCSCNVPLPSANEVWRFCLTHSNGLGDQRENECSCGCHIVS